MSNTKGNRLKKQIWEMDALHNQIDFIKLKGYVLKKAPTNRTNLYFLADESGKRLTGDWKYSDLNMYLLGYAEALRKK